MVLEKYTFNKLEFAIDRFLRMRLDNVKKAIKKKWDIVFIIDGIEGSGKSTLGFICAWYLTTGRLTLFNLAEGTKDAISKLEKLPDGSLLVIDEGSLSFGSTDVMKKEHKRLIKILQVIRQKNMCLIIVAPSFFDLSKYISIQRIRFLLHVYTKNDMVRGKYCYFGEKKKKMLYLIGKKHFNSYAKPKSDFVGRFIDFKLPFDKEYQKLKKRTLKEAFSKEDEKHEVHSIKYKLSQLKFPMKNKVEFAKQMKIHKENLVVWGKRYNSLEKLEKNSEQ